MQLLRTLYISDHSAKVRIRKGNVVVAGCEQTIRVPIETLEAIVLTGRGEVSNDALGEFTRRGIRVSAISKAGRLRFTVGGPAGGNVLLRMQQYRVATDASQQLGVARVLVAGKLQNCRRMMNRWAWDATSGSTRIGMAAEIREIEERLMNLSTATDGDTVRGIEGDGTRRYFRVMGDHLGRDRTATDFPRRSRRPPRDPVNALLGFVYGLLLTEVIGALEAVGLDPQLGFLHMPRPGRPSLALDMIEELRPSVADRFVVASLKRGQLDLPDFERRAGNAVYLNETGRNKVLRLWDEYRSVEIMHPLLDRTIQRSVLPSVQATLMARFLRGDLTSYTPFVTL